MKILNMLSDLTDGELGQLEQNALASRDSSKADQAKQVLVAVAEERKRRKEKARLAQATELSRIRERVSHFNLEQRVEAAFTEMPPMEWEHAALIALARQPGATTEELSSALGYSGTYINWFGQVCRDREAWLGPAAPGPDGKIIYSGLLVDFQVKTDPSSGRSTTQWWLKPEVMSALKRLAFI